MSTTAAHKSTPHSARGGKTTTPEASLPEKSNSHRGVFLGMALNMSWQLAIVVLAPIIGGAELDKHLNTGYTFTLLGLLVAIAASSVVVWRALQVANQLPVPKLTPKQRREIQKSYEEDDE